MRPASAHAGARRPRSAVSSLRARCAAEAAREQAATRDRSMPRMGRGAASGPAGNSGRTGDGDSDSDNRSSGSGSDGSSSRSQTARPTADTPSSCAETDEITRSLLARWESAGRLMRRLPAAAAHVVPHENGDDSSNGSSDSEDEEGDDLMGAGWVAPSVVAFDFAASRAAILDGAEVRLYKWLPKLQLWLQRELITSTAVAQPQGLAVLDGGELAVTDGHRRTVVVFDSDGHERRTIGDGLTRGSLVRPSALAADASGTTLAIFDSEPARVQLHRASTGALLRTLPLHALGVTSVPAGGMAFDGCGHVLVCDQVGHRVLRLRIFDGGCSATMASDRLTCPGAVVAVADGTAIVGNGSTLQVFRPDGRWLRSVAVGRGGNASTHAYIAGIAIDACGHLFVSQQQVQPGCNIACDGKSGSLLVLSGPGRDAPVQESASAARGQKELPPSAVGCLKSAQKLRRRRRVALLLKEQLLTSIIDRKLTIRGLFSAAETDTSGRKLKTDCRQASTNEQRVESAHLAEALQRLGLNASKEEVDELLSLLALPAGNAEEEHVCREDEFKNAITMEIPAACFVSIRQLEQLKLARLTESDSSVTKSQKLTAKTRRRNEPQYRQVPAKPEAPTEATTTAGTMDDDAALRALRTLVALSPSQENEKRQWEFYDNQVAAAEAAERPVPNPPSALLGHARTPPCRCKPAAQKASTDLLSAYHAAALSPCAEPSKTDPAIVARNSLLSLSLDASMNDSEKLGTEASVLGATDPQ